jgi:hypothetical protein
MIREVCICEDADALADLSLGEVLLEVQAQHLTLAG